MKKIAMVSLLLFCFSTAWAVKQPLFPAEAFQFSAKQAGNQVVLHWIIAPGYYLYQSRFKFEFEPDGVKKGAVDFPKGTTKEDAFLGKYTVYKNALHLNIPFKSSIEGPGKLTVIYHVVVHHISVSTVHFEIAHHFLSGDIYFARYDSLFRIGAYLATGAFPHGHQLP